MPEGPEIKRAADEIAQAIAHQPIREIFFAFAHLKSYEQQLTNALIYNVQTYGKALLLRFDNGLNIYNHNQLYGKWIVRSAYSYPDTKRQLRLALHTEKKSALLYSASEIDVLHDEQINAHPFISRLGPDVLDASTTVNQVCQRLQSPPFTKRQFTSLLLDQRFLAGLGNYLRSEILFVARIHPTMRPIDCSSAQLTTLAQAMLAVPYQSYLTGGITNDLQLANQLKAQGKKRSSYRHWVFNREDQPCFVCMTKIVKAVSGGRRYYFCPTCQ